MQHLKCLKTQESLSCIQRSLTGSFNSQIQLLELWSKASKPTKFWCTINLEIMTVPIPTLSGSPYILSCQTYWCLFPDRPMHDQEACEYLLVHFWAFSNCRSLEKKKTMDYQFPGPIPHHGLIKKLGSNTTVLYQVNSLCGYIHANHIYDTCTHAWVRICRYACMSPIFAV